MPKGIEIRDLTVGIGDEATKESVVVVNVKTFLRRGDEVSPSPLFGARDLINLRRRDRIAGLRYGIPGMRVGGRREIVISPHLAYGEKGVPGQIPPNALLRCEVELLEIREHEALLPQDWLPGKILLIRRYEDTDNQQPGWHVSMHESGNLHLTLRETTPDEWTKGQPCWSQIPIPVEAKKSAELIRQATDLPIQIPEDCLGWNSGFIDMPRGDAVIRDNRNGARCMVVQVMESGKSLLIFGVHEGSPSFLGSEFYRTVEQLINPHLGR